MSMRTEHATEIDSILWKLHRNATGLCYQSFCDDMFATTGELYGNGVEDLEAMLRAKSHVISIVIEHGQKVVAMAIHNVINSRISLDVLWTRPKYRGRGLANLLMNNVANYHERAVPGDVEMEVDVPAGDVDLVGYYEQHGFDVEHTVLVKKFPRTKTIDCSTEE